MFGFYMVDTVQQQQYEYVVQCTDSSSSSINVLGSLQQLLLCLEHIYLLYYYCTACCKQYLDLLLPWQESTFRYIT